LSLLMTDAGQRPRKAVLVPIELGPIRTRVRVPNSGPHSCDADPVTALCIARERWRSAAWCHSLSP
jgi:hypothetical protein